jgi:hypothetical protein
MSVYQYVADSDPRGTQRLIESFGYEITDQRNLGKSLSELVSNVGEPALKKVIDLHPDKDIILEYNASTMPTSTSCSCDSCKSKGKHDKYMNASGSETTTDTSVASTNNTNILAHQTNTILVLATLVIIAGIMLKNK